MTTEARPWDDDRISYEVDDLTKYVTHDGKIYGMTHSDDVERLLRRIANASSAGAGVNGHRNGENSEPTVSGWYWFDGVGKWRQTPPETISKRPVFVEIDEEEGGAIIWYGAHDDANYACADGWLFGQWYGPIVSPWQHAPAPVTLEAILRDVTDWQAMQFPHRTANSIATHLLEEAQELQREPTDVEEMADVLMLLAGLAHFNGYDLAKAVSDKLAINKARTWGKPDEVGVVRHEQHAPALPQIQQEGDDAN